MTQAVLCRSGGNNLFARFAASGRRNASSRIFVKDVGSNSGCPGVVTIGVDLTQEPGLSGINFFGRETSELLLGVGEALKAIGVRLA